MSITARISLIAALMVIVVFFFLQTSVVLRIIDPTWTISLIGYGCFLVFCPFFYLFFREFRKRQKEGAAQQELYIRNEQEIKHRLSEIGELYQFLDEAAIISRTDTAGTITYVNDKFLEISGYSREELVGGNHRIVNSGLHSREFWIEMYRTTLRERKVWNGLVTNRAKNGNLYYVETFIKADFDPSTGKHTGYTSIRQDLSNIKRNEQEIKNKLSEIGELYQFLDEATIISRTDTTGTITYVNDKFVEISGYTREVLIGGNHRIVNSGLHSREFWIDMYRTTLRERKVWNGLVTNRAKNGTLYYVETFIKADFDPSTGKHIGFTSIRQDLSSIKRNEQEIKNKLSEIGELYQFLDEATIISRTDTTGTITYVNDKFEEISGYTRDVLIGGNHRIVNSGLHSREFWIDMYRTTLRERKVWNGLVTNRSKNGILYYVETFIKADFDPSTGKHIGFTSIRQDLSTIKRKELDFRHRMDAINKANAVIEFDVEGNIIYANDRYHELMDYPKGSLQGQHHSLFISPIYAKTEAYAEFWKQLRDGHFVSSEFDRYDRTGKRVWLKATYNPIQDAEGKVVSIMEIAADITQRIEQTIEIDRKNSYLEHAARILRHDMHSGINVYMPRGISSLSKRIPPEVISTYSLEPPLKLIREGLAHTQKVYRGVYEFANLVKPGSTLNLSEVNLGEILRSFLATTAYKDQVDIGELGSATVSESLFCTAIDNLVRNGLKYNDSPVKIVRISRLGDILVVEDNGRGMTQDEFDHFSKTGTRREGQKEAGSGLGLGICIAILREHGFHVTCDKLQPVGSSIKIRLK